MIRHAGYRLSGISLMIAAICASALVQAQSFPSRANPISTALPSATVKGQTMPSGSTALKPRAASRKPIRVELNENYSDVQIVLKFHEGTGIRLRKGRL